MYGVTDFALMRRENAYYVDKTAQIRELERTNYTLFLRPRRFGKSLLCSVLQCYYDVDYAGEFERFFGELAIGRDPTPEHSQYLFLDFNFSGVEKRFDRVQDSFNSYCSDRLNVFAERNAGRLPQGTAQAVLKAPTCHEKLNALVNRLKGTGKKLYIVIDEYDNFTNTILAESKDNYMALCHGEGFFKQFFNELKLSTTGTDAPVTRMFITGVTPVTLDDVTSGFNIAANISLDRTFACWTGFTHDELRTMLGYYQGNADFEFDADGVLDTMLRWYDGYRFAPTSGELVPSVANPTLVFAYMRYLLLNREPMPELIDENLRTDYMKIRHIITEGHRVNGNYHRLEDLVRKHGATAVLRKSFRATELGTSDNFISFLFYNGLVSIVGEAMGRSRLSIPNLTVGEFIHDFIGKAYGDVYGVDSRIFDIANGMTDFAECGEWHLALDTACSVVSQYLRVRDAIEGERVVQTALASLLYVGHGPYIVHHEQEANGGFVDIAFEPQLNRWPQIGYAAQIELKYLKSEEQSTAEALAAVREQAMAQLDRYAAAHDLKKAWQLKPDGHVLLKRFVIVFHGTECVMCEEVES